ncbi:NUDIX hydrolase [Candidatus Uhrbacteria bacterium]|nr:NUDIX hydrolase [Candidatus Uhrbacteria bacterium]
MAKIPDEAKKVFEGVIFDVYQWQQKMFDGTAQTFERIKRVNTAEMIVTQGDLILIQEEQQPDREPFLTFPGGRIENDEDPLAAAKRELLEETGYACDRWSLYREVMPIVKIDWTVYLFVGQDARWVQDPHLDAGEKISVRWVTLDEFLDLADSGKLTYFLEQFRTEFVRAKYHAPSREALRQKLFTASP